MLMEAVMCPDHPDTQNGDMGCVTQRRSNCRQKEKDLSKHYDPNAIQAKNLLAQPNARLAKTDEMAMPNWWARPNSSPEPISAGVARTGGSRSRQRTKINLIDRDVVSKQSHYQGSLP